MRKSSCQETVSCNDRLHTSLATNQYTAQIKFPHRHYSTDFIPPDFHVSDALKRLSVTTITSFCNTEEVKVAIMVWAGGALLTFFKVTYKNGSKGGTNVLSAKEVILNSGILWTNVRCSHVHKILSFKLLLTIKLWADTDYFQYTSRILTTLFRLSLMIFVRAYVLIYSLFLKMPSL